MASAGEGQISISHHIVHLASMRDAIPHVGRQCDHFGILVGMFLFSLHVAARPDSM